MATGSQAASRQRRDAAHYHTGVYSGQRCDGCKHCRPAMVSFGATKKDRHCVLHKAPVKTHGVCAQWAAK